MMIDLALLAQSSGSGGPGCVANLVPLALIVVIFWFLVIRPERQKQQEHEDFLASLKVGDQVVTAGGLFGEVKSVDETTVTLQINRDNRVQVLRQQVKGPESEYLDSDEGDSENEDDGD
jgi:preprotein translocase subunit YajC